jgi:protein-disulfide isomerase
MASSSKQRQRANRNNRVERKIVHRKRQRTRLLTVVGSALVLALVAVVVLVALNRDSSPGGDNALPTVVAGSVPAASIERNGLTIGSADAPVLLTEYGDYQCPFCGQFNSTGFQTLLSTYIATGQVRLAFSPFSFLGNESNEATEAALCAADQGRFWEMHEALYANQAGENKGAFSDSRLNDIATAAGLDMSAYTTCMANNTHANDVTTFNSGADAAGVRSTPSFAINGGPAFAYKSLDDLEGRIKTALGQ